MRLIDADAFKNYVRKHCKDSLAYLWCELIKRQPTAYDVEEVIKQLKSEGCIIDDESGNRAVDIIMKGGTE